MVSWKNFLVRNGLKKGNNSPKNPPLVPLYTVNSIDAHIGITTSKTHSKPNKSDKMAFVQVLRIKEIFIALQLVLLPLSLQHAAPCPAIEQEMVVATTSEAETLAEALRCDGPGVFTVSWNGDVPISRTISGSNGSTLDVTGSSSESTNGAVIGDGTVPLFEVDLGLNLLLTGLTFSGGSGSLLVAGGSIVEMVDCSFIFNNKISTSSFSFGGGLVVLFLSSCPHPIARGEM